jgi:hypothetical protein
MLMRVGVKVGPAVVRMVNVTDRISLLIEFARLRVRLA